LISRKRKGAGLVRAHEPAQRPNPRLRETADNRSFRQMSIIADRTAPSTDHRDLEIESQFDADLASALKALK
jgi:hypothetical protein